VRDDQHGHIHDRGHMRRSQLPRQCRKPDLRGVVIVEDEIDQPNEIERDDEQPEERTYSYREKRHDGEHTGEQSQPGTAWKTIVKAYLSPEHSDHPECGCPLAALAPDLARTDKTMKAQILGELRSYRRGILPFMPGRRAADKERAFVVIFSTMLGAVAIARILPDRASRAKVLASTRDFLLRSF
jgi:TetR/AcrR family transcriptional regulator, transcriptional repressor for nem operon